MPCAAPVTNTTLLLKRCPMCVTISLLFLAHSERTRPPKDTGTNSTAHISFVAPRGSMTNEEADTLPNVSGVRELSPPLDSRHVLYKSSGVVGDLLEQLALV